MYTCTGCEKPILGEWDVTILEGRSAWLGRTAHLTIQGAPYGSNGWGVRVVLVSGSDTKPFPGESWNQAWTLDSHIIEVKEVGRKNKTWKFQVK